MARSKYGAKPVEIDGIRFASQKEGRRYQELKLLVKAGHIKQLELQPVFRLWAHDVTVQARLKRAAAGMRGNPDPVTPIELGKYVADFRYQEKGLSASENERWHVVVEDVKGFKTPLYRWKKRHVEAQYGITIREL